MKITDIRRQKHNTDKFNIFIDGEYSFSLSVDYVLNNDIKIGLELTNFDIERIKIEDRGNIAFLSAVNYLSYSFRTEKEVRAKLKEKEFTDEEISFAITKLLNYGYIDDKSYAYSYIRDKSQLSGWGEQKIKTKLYQKGVSSDIINELIEELYSEEDMLKNAIEIGNKKLKSLNKYEPRKQKEKLFMFLASKGFKYDIVKQAIDKIYND